MDFWAPAFKIDFNIEHLAAFFTLLTAIVSGAIWGWSAIRTAILRASESEERALLNEGRIDALWKLARTRGQVEAVMQGKAVEDTTRQGASRPWKVDSKMRITLRPEIRQIFDPIAADLRAIYRSRAWPKEQLIEFLDARYGDWLVRNVCLPQGLHDMACLAMAEEVAMEQDEPEGNDSLLPQPVGTI